MEFIKIKENYRTININPSAMLQNLDLEYLLKFHANNLSPNVEAMNIYLKLFVFMKNQFNNYEIENSTILFETEEILSEYNELIGRLDYCTEITIKQTDLRAKVLKEYTQLINSVKQK